MMKRVELLSQAGDMERLELAVKFGADAVYVGNPIRYALQPIQF